MIVSRLPEGRDTNVPYERLASAEQDVRERLRDRGEDFHAVRAIWTPANADSDVLVEVWRGHGRELRADVVRP